jgi:hypothetical protein
MLARLQVNNTTANVYMCPSGKTAYVYVDIASSDGSSYVNMSVQVGDGTTFYTYWAGWTNFLSVLLVLNGGDVVRVWTSGIVNVFVHGKEF